MNPLSNTVEFNEFPELHEYYSRRMSSGKRPKKIILTEIYDSPSKESYKYYNQSKPSDLECYSNYKKKIYQNDFDIYSPSADNRINIKKKIYSTPEHYLKGNEDFLENFQYYERKNIKEKINPKYESYTRVVGYSTVIPLEYQKKTKTINNYSTININKNNNNKINYNYMKNKEDMNKNNYIKKKEVNLIKTTQKIQKNEYKKPEIKIDTSKKYSINKKQEIKTKTNMDNYRIKQKSEIKQKSLNKNKLVQKKEVKEPIIIKRRESIKKEFKVKSGRYSYKDNISNDIINSRKNYNANSQDKNIKRINVVESSKSKNKKIATTTNNNKQTNKTVNTKININIKNNNYKKKATDAHKINLKTESYGKIDKNKYQKKNEINNKNLIQKKTNIEEMENIYSLKNKFENRNCICPKMKKINLGDNYRFYERKYLRSPDNDYFTIHHRRDEREIYGEEEIENINPYRIETKFNNYKTISNSYNDGNFNYIDNNDDYNEQEGFYYY